MRFADAVHISSVDVDNLGEVGEYFVREFIKEVDKGNSEARRSSERSLFKLWRFVEDKYGVKITAFRGLDGLNHYLGFMSYDLRHKVPWGMLEAAV